MQIRYDKILSGIIRFPKHLIAYCLLFAITIQSLAPGIVLCFENSDDTEVNFCLKEKCCSLSESSEQLFHELDFRTQPLDDSCKKCVEVPLYKSLNQKNSTEEKPVNLLTLALSTSPCSSVNHIEKSSTKRKFPLAPGNNSCLFSLQTVILQV